MWALQYYVTLDSNAQAALDGLNVTLNNLITAISTQGRKIMGALDDLKTANEGLIAEIAAAKTQFSADVAKISDGLAKISDLTAQLAAAASANNEQAISQIASALSAETADLKASVDAAAAATQPPAPAAA